MYTPCHRPACNCIYRPQNFVYIQDAPTVYHNQGYNPYLDYQQTYCQQDLSVSWICESFPKNEEWSTHQTSELNLYPLQPELHQEPQPVVENVGSAVITNLNTFDFSNSGQSLYETEGTPSLTLSWDI